jgi:uncharacterized protein YbjQ (UPF0145 family)
MKLTENMDRQTDFLITRVVTRHLVSDFFQGIRNIFGLRLRSYEELIKSAHTEMIEEMKLTYGNKVIWYRFSFNPLAKEAIMINLYGVLK